MTSYYSFGEVTLTDDGWVREYLAHVNGFIQKHGGRVAMFEDPDYRPLRDKRQAGSESEFYLFPAEDLAPPSPTE